MKILVNKANPTFRITTPEIIEEEEYYTLDGETVFLKENWTLVEEEPKNTEVWLEGRTIFEQDAKKPEVDLEEDTDFINERARMWKDYKERFDGDKIDYNHLIRHFYELGKKGGNK